MRILLRVPEHAEAERPRRILDALDQAVRRDRRRDQAVADPAEALVVVRVDLRRALAEDLAQLAAASISTSWRPNVPSCGRWGARS